jgi:hypothetical protein
VDIPAAFQHGPAAFAIAAPEMDNGPHEKEETPGDSRASVFRIRH